MTDNSKIHISRIEGLEDALGGRSIPLLSHIFCDHQINDIQWLRGDTFSWQDGTVYSAVYNELLSEYNNASSTTETEGSITFKRTPKGYKIASAEEESDILSLYNTTGVAWYYILDTTNHRFKLPRTKYGFVGLRNYPGNYVAESLPNITGRSATSKPGNNDNSAAVTGALYIASGSEGINNSQTNAGNSNDYNTLHIDASRSSSAYQNGAPVQQRATQMYLYFYVGNYTQPAIEQTAGLNAELFNGKLDLNASNLNTQGKSLISGLSMPSATYIDLTLGATGATYTAPANGWFVSYFKCTGAQIGTWVNAATGMSNAGSTAGSWNTVGSSIPVKSGDVCKYYYNHPTGASNVYAFRFVYAIGTESEA